MSGEFNYNISPAYGHRRGSDYPPYSSNDRNYALTTLISPLGPSITSSRIANRGPSNPLLGRTDIHTWERIPTTGLPFPRLVINNGPRTIPEAPTFSGGNQEHRQPPSRLSPAVQASAVGQLKKTTYNPGPKRMASRLCLYYRDQARVLPKEKEEEDEGKRCAVCLEDFEAKDEVMVTPCDHMFHEDCIVPWATSQGQCPVCRFVLASSKSAPIASVSGSSGPPRVGAATGSGDGVLDGDLRWFVEAVEEAMMRGDRLPTLMYY